MLKRLRRRLRRGGGGGGKDDLVVDVSRSELEDDDDDVGGAESDDDDEELKKRRPKETAKQAEERAFVTKTLRKFTVDRLAMIVDTMTTNERQNRNGSKSWRSPKQDFHVGTHTLTLAEVEDALAWKGRHFVELRAELVTPTTTRMGQAWNGQWGAGAVLDVKQTQLKEVGADDISLADIWGLGPTIAVPDDNEWNFNE